MNRTRTGSAIRKQRTRLGVAAAELASALGVEVGLLDRIEAGEVDLDLPLLGRIADLLGVSADELLSGKPRSSGVAMALRAEAPLTAAARFVLADAQSAVRDTADVRGNAWVQERLQRFREVRRASEDPHRDRRASDQGIRLAAHVRDRMGLALEPIASVRRQLEEWGVLVVEMDLGSDDLDGVALYDPETGPAVLLNHHAGGRSELPTARRITALHELCHLLRDVDVWAKKPLGVLDREGMEDTREARAFAFAVHLLAPEAAVRERLRTLSVPPGGRVPADALRDLCVLFGVGVDAMAAHVERSLRLGEVDRAGPAEIRRESLVQFGAQESLPDEVRPPAPEIPLHRRGALLSAVRESWTRGELTTGDVRALLRLSVDRNVEAILG